MDQDHNKAVAIGLVFRQQSAREGIWGTVKRLSWIPKKICSALCPSATMAWALHLVAFFSQPDFSGAAGAESDLILEAEANRKVWQ